MAAPVYITGDVPPAADFNEWYVNNHIAVKSADESVTASTALQDDNHLTLPVLASAAYDVWMVLAVDGPTAADFKFQFTVPTGANFYGRCHSLPTGAADTLSPRLDRMTETNPLGYGTLGVGVPSIVDVTGYLAIGSTAGTLTLQWAQNTSNGTAVRVLTGSRLSLRRVV